MPFKSIKRIARKTARGAVALAAPLLFKRYFVQGGLASKRFNWKGKRAAATISFDLDYPEDVQCVPALLEQLEPFGFRASFACVGRWVEAFPRVHEKIVDARCEIINHTLTHPNNELLNPNEFFNKLGAREQESEIAGFERVCKKVLGVTPRGFRAPHFGSLNSQSVYEILARRGYLYSSSTNLTRTASRGFPYAPSKKDFRKKTPPCYDLLELPLMSCPRHYFSVFDSWHCFRASPPAHHRKGEFSQVFKEAIDVARRYGVYANFYFDPRDVAGTREFERALGFLGERKKDLWVAPSAEIAEFWKKEAEKRKKR